MLEEAKSFGWIKEHALCGPNSQSFPELTRGVRGVSTRGRDWTSRCFQTAGQRERRRWVRG